MTLGPGLAAAAALAATLAAAAPGPAPAEPLLRGAPLAVSGIELTAVAREGGLALEGREIVPTTDSSEEGSGFLVVDREARPGERYRYRVAALTRDGFLSEAFEAAVQTE